MKKRKKARKTADGRVIVDSRAYGEHTRAPRGTYKEATLNNTMKASSSALVRSNEDANLIKTALSPYFYQPSPGLFWQRILSTVRHSYDNNHVIRPEKFEGFDVYSEYRISRMFSPQSLITGNLQSINIMIQWEKAPDFKRRFADGYMIGVICIWIDPENKRIESMLKYSEFFSLRADSGNCAFTFDHPINSGYCLVFLTVNATEKQILCRGAATSGFRCIWGRRLENMAAPEAVQPGI